MARNILFTPPNDQLIIDGLKDMTARYWVNPPKMSEICTASTGRRKETRFAEIKIVGAFMWNPLTDSMLEIADIHERTGYSLQEIVTKEGFRSWEEFIDAYVSLNKHKDFDDPKRNHYLIDFRVHKLLDVGQMELEL